MTAADLLPLVLLGAVIGFDTVSFPQAMLARPIVAATLGGALVGSALLGALCGAILECFALETLPVGASRYPEWGSASVVAGAMVGDAHAATVDALLIAVIVALAGAWLGGWSMVQLRSLNARRVRRSQDAIARGDGRVIRNLHLQGLLADLLRGAALTSVLLAIALPLRDVSERASQGLTLSVGRPMLAMVAVAVAVSAVWKHFAGVPYARAIIAVALASSVAWFFLT